MFGFAVIPPRNPSLCIPSYGRLLYTTVPAHRLFLFLSLSSSLSLSLSLSLSAGLFCLRCSHSFSYVCPLLSFIWALSWFGIGAKKEQDLIYRLTTC
ncbi:hypothetical protein P168DRAFT_44025 [Aspergillus campestris IBT 28561]|uniref:Uncharacterized protein n=1 Tax=Aspergillus campestris (strain IBT 28561) TaxID=1392248 RepID=A0A2I1CXA8_ASPC2|nr:uncharacterized protein P168DRAFT_44025 [Aspergillus campestris IBT 28561]PKY02266.1 hypothetical protein P168DRAFT_44025 [Aspergillus campestris IBT 28561]